MWSGSRALHVFEHFEIEILDDFGLCLSGLGVEEVIPNYHENSSEPLFDVLLLW